MPPRRLPGGEDSEYGLGKVVMYERCSGERVQAKVIDIDWDAGICELEYDVLSQSGDGLLSHRWGATRLSALKLEEQPRLPYERRALTLKQLQRLARCFVESGWLDAQCKEFNESFEVEIEAGTEYKKEPNLYAIDGFLVKPLTDPEQFEGIPAELRAEAKLPPPARKSSFAEVLNAARGGGLVDFFVSHFWGHLFWRTVAALTKFAASQGGPLEAHSFFSFWICLFAVNQHCAGEEVGSSPEDGPFNAALEAARGVVMVVDEHVEPFKRIWCLYEVQRVHDLSTGKTFELELIDEGGSIATNPEMMKSVADSLETASAATAQASINQDKWSIWYLVADPSIRRTFGTADIFKRYASDMPGFFCQFDARLSKLLAEPLLRAAVEAGDQETALRCIAWGAAGQQGDYLHKAMTMWSDDCLSAATVKTRFSRHPQKLSTVMAYFGNTVGVQLLREAGADLAVSDKDGRTSAHYAAGKGHLEVLELLQAAGADLAAVDNDGRTPAHHAALDGQLEVLQLLREAGADLAAVANDGRTPAHFAAGNGHLEVLQLLREAGADLAAVANDGRTPVHFAAQNGHLEVLQLLREAGADLAAVGKDGRTPAHHAALDGRLEVLQLLREAGIDLVAVSNNGRTPAHFAAGTGHLEVLQLLQEAGADLAAVGNDGRTPAHHAALYGQLEVLQLLQEAGADLAAVANDGRTPAHFAAGNGHLEVLQLLREAGADLAAVANDGRTPAHHAALDDLEVLQLLREAGADLAAVDDDGKTPAH